jgi:CheY-like chemotaxis protein
MKNNCTYTYAVCGIIIGICFPLIATPFDIWMSDMDFSWASVVHVQTTQPLHLIIDTAPLFLGLIAAYTGKKQGEIRLHNDMLDQIAQEKTSDLLEQNMLLKDEVEQRTKTEIALIKARDEAEEAKHAEERFLANMSHEIRTPLNSMLGFTRLMMDTNIDQQQGEYLKSIKYSSNHLLAIINDILELSKIKAGQIDFEVWGDSFDVDFAINGKEAVELFVENDYDLVLMDLQMPIMDGFTACEFIRTQLDPPKRDIPIIALTADVLASERKRAFQVGMNEYVTKPFKPHELYFKMFKSIQDYRESLI